MAARIGRLPGRRPEPQPATSPYDMLSVTIGGIATVARPYELVTDAKSQQYPSKASTSCPQCGHGINFDVRQDQLLSNTITAACANCGIGMIDTVPPEDPFRNPVIDGVVARGELDPLYTDPLSLANNPSTAAERIAQQRDERKQKGPEKPTKKPTKDKKPSAVHQPPKRQDDPKKARPDDRTLSDVSESESGEESDILMPDADDFMHIAPFDNSDATQMGEEP